MRRSWIVIVLVLVVVAGAYGPRAVSISASGRSHAAVAPKKCKKGYHRVRGKCKRKHVPSLAQRVDDYLKGATAFEGSVLIASKGKLLVRKSYGMADQEQKVAITPQTLFRLASISKQFTAVAIMQLQEQGKLSVRDRACTYIDNCPALWRDITIHQLLTQTSGITNLVSEGSRPNDAVPGVVQTRYQSPAELLDLVRNIPLLFQPGTNWHYTNMGYVALGLIIERVSGEPYATFLKDHIFGPLGMTSSGVAQDGVTVPNIATGYDAGTVVSAAAFNPANAAAASGLYSTVDDLYLWDQALTTEKLVSRKSLDAIFTPAYTLSTLDAQGFGFLDGASYGYGWFIGTESGHRTIRHGGGAPGIRTMNAFFPDDGVTIIVLSNEDQTGMFTIIDYLESLTVGAKTVRY
jgi:CubicO group peptidase (beta-lactamase class C family)